MNRLPDKARFMEELSSNEKVTEADKIILNIVYEFSLLHHLNAPKRATGEHYFWHIYRAVMRLLDVFLLLDIWDVKVVIILLLHDTIEDARKAGFDPALVLTEIIHRFDAEIAFGTMAITKKEKEHSKDVLRKLILLFYWRSHVAKSFDREDNLSTLHGMQINSQLKKLAETEKYFPSIFNRLESELIIAVTYRKYDKNWLRLVPWLRIRQRKLVTENRDRLKNLSDT